MRTLVAEATVDFPASAGVWEALQTRGKLLGPDEGFVWGLLPLAICAGMDVAPEAVWNLSAAT
ncbi:MAG TPA: hypothetical protein VF221_00630, partial [Chloroflexota bacterium]